MADLISQYRQDLEVILRQTMPPFEAQTVADEVEHHLRERFEASVELGASPETAQLEALAAMGPSTALAKEFASESKRRWTLDKVPANVAMFGLLLLPIVFQAQFLRNDVFNVVTILSWALLPAFCRKLPIWGLISGVVLLEFVLVFPRHQTIALSELFGMSLFVAATVMSYFIGVLVRWSKRRILLLLSRS